MCTVTVVPTTDGYRMMCNRDEQHTRPEATPPRVWRIGGLRAIFPIDPYGGGTWIGANEAALSMAILNAAEQPGDSTGRCNARRSRGLLIPRLLDQAGIDGVIRAIDEVNVADYRPFRLVALHGRDLCVLSSHEQTTDVRRVKVSEPALFTSSSLGDAEAAATRQPLFETLVMRASDSWLAGQLRFHDHQWPERPALSVRMQRSDARTVSQSVIDVYATDIRMEYAPIPRVGARAPR